MQDGAPSAALNGHASRAVQDELSMSSSDGREAGGAFAKKQVGLRPRANSKTLTVAPALANASATSSSTYAASPLSYRSAAPPQPPSSSHSQHSSGYASPVHPYPHTGPHTPTFASAFPVTPPATPGPYWPKVASDGRGLGLSTAKDDGVKGWLKGAAQGTTVWLTPGTDKNGKRRVSDGILSPQAESYNERFRRDALGSAWRRWLRSRGPQTPFARLVVFVAALLLTFFLYRLSSAPSAPAAGYRHGGHALGAPRFRQTYQAIPSSAEYNSLRVQAAYASPASSDNAGAPAKAAWVWRDAREELGCLLHYVTSSGNAALPDINPDEPLDPQLILDFNPHSHANGARSGRRMVEQTVDDFWNGKSTLGGGKVVILGKETDPAALSIRLVLEDLEIDTEGIFVNVEGRSDTYQLNRLIERIISVPRLPALIIGGRPIGSYLQMMSMQYSGELYSALDDAGVKYLRPDDDDEYQTEDDDDEAVQPW